MGERAIRENSLKLITGKNGKLSNHENRVYQNAQTINKLLLKRSK